jgi:hypothetical protein
MFRTLNLKSSNRRTKTRIRDRDAIKTLKIQTGETEIRKKMIQTTKQQARQAL